MESTILKNKEIFTGIDDHCDRKIFNRYGDRSKVYKVYNDEEGNKFKALYLKKLINGEAVRIDIKPSRVSKYRTSITFDKYRKTFTIHKTLLEELLVEKKNLVFESVLEEIMYEPKKIMVDNIEEFLDKTKIGYDTCRVYNEFINGIQVGLVARRLCGYNDSGRIVDLINIYGRVSGAMIDIYSNQKDLNISFCNSSDEIYNILKGISNLLNVKIICNGGTTNGVVIKPNN